MSKQLLMILPAILIALFPLYSKADLKVGDRAPDFALTDQWGKTVRLSDFKGKKTVVLAFYIKASTPG
jgi:peroxiredoxin Q/BCP